MDDQRTDRKSGLKRLLLAMATIPVVLTVGYLAIIASLGVRMAVRNYDPEMASFFAAATYGFICGVAATIGATQFLRRYKVSIKHFRLRDLLLSMTILAITFGLISYVLNKK
jgi:hypothetical protein